MIFLSIARQGERGRKIPENPPRSRGFKSAAFSDEKYIHSRRAPFAISARASSKNDFRAGARRSHCVLSLVNPDPARDRHRAHDLGVTPPPLCAPKKSSLARALIEETRRKAGASKSSPPRISLFLSPSLYDRLFVGVICGVAAAASGGGGAATAAAILVRKKQCSELLQPYRRASPLLFIAIKRRGSLRECARAKCAVRFGVV